MDDQPTQPLTQQVLDPRRLGRNNSGLSESDISDVLCILHPASLAAYRIVSDTAIYKPQHILQNESLISYNEYGANIDEQETIILDGGGMSAAGNDLALRMSSNTVNPHLGFSFGRNAQMCDIMILRDSAKRFSNVHCRIYVNHNGVLMLEDVSTNGTLVDDVFLKGKESNYPSTRMINPGSIIQILSSVEDEKIKFIVRFPSREGHEHEYQRKFTNYVARCAIANDRGRGRGRQGTNLKIAGAPGNLIEGRGTASVLPNAYSNSHGMQWNGGNKYNVVGMLGKGAFATVYQLATALDGEPLAAKELEKRRFMKNGQLDQRLDNEMRIMKELRHPNIVQYIDYQDVGRHLYIIMEYVPCGDLQGYLSTKGNLPEHSAKLMARQILSSLAYLHKKKITHRDIKPDNILIACEDPFTVKLSDFGLSKVVKNNETFLKTFCGTLLYCAPEVFPHYDAHVAAQGTKRRRGTAQKSTFHSYSQSVDVWSFAAVLWFALCGSPPFEGVSDPTGKGMFNKIMETSLDVTPLKRVGISNECIDLLLKMLNTDPTSRPTERQCLRHKWLYDGTEVADDAPLNAIQEEEEDNGAEEAEEQLSQLSIHEKSSGSDAPSDEEEVDFATEDFDFLLNKNPSKRVKTDQLFPRNQPRDRDDFDSSPEASYHSAAGQAGEIPDESFALIPQPAGRPRLFGEIGQSALRSSGVLDVQANAALSIYTSDDKAPHPDNHQSALLRNGAEPASSPSADRIIAQMDGVLSSPSLLGAESLVRELNMTSPQSPNSAAATPNEPSTPKTPEVEQHSSLDLGETMSSERTPKAPVFNRQINLRKTASFYYDPYDPTTHNLEYASKVSGHDFVAEAAASKDALHGLPDTMHFSASSSENGSTHANISANSTPVTTSMPAEFLRPPPRLGKLTATPDSFSPIVLKLDQNNTSWGRLLENTIVYPQVNDTRIPKKAFTIWFHAEEGHDFKELEEQGRDWTKLDGLYTGINTFTRNGIYVNGVHLRQKDDKGRVLYGRLYSGDVITVFLDRKEGKCLKFVCEFYHGAARQKREPGTRFEVKKGS